MEIRERQTRNQFLPGYKAAPKLGINSHLLSRITGTLFVLKGPKEAELDHASKVNIGLNLKNNKRGEEVCGFTRKTAENTWLYSPKVMEAVREYMRLFPEVFQYLSGTNGSNGDYYHESDIFTEDSDAEKLKELSEWIREQEFYNASRQPCGTLTIDESIVSSIEDIVSDLADGQPLKKKITMQLKPHLIFKPSLFKGAGPPDQDADYRLFDRVVNVRQGFSVPLGLRGTIIGILKADKPENSFVEVLFDQEFHGGLNIRTPSKKAYRVPRTALINLSFGNRMNQNPGNRDGQKMKPGTVQPTDQRRNGNSAQSHNKESSPTKSVKYVSAPDPSSLPTPTDFLRGKESKRGKKGGNTQQSFDMNQLWQSLQAPNPDPPVQATTDSVQEFFSLAAPISMQDAQISMQDAQQPNFMASTSFVPLQVSLRGTKPGRGTGGRGGKFGRRDKKDMGQFEDANSNEKTHTFVQDENFQRPARTNQHRRGGGQSRGRRGGGAKLAANFSNISQ